MAEAVKYKAYPRRFAIAGLFGLSNATNAFMWIIYSPIVTIVEARYGVSTLAVNMLSLVFMILYLPGSFLGLYMMERYGMRNSLVVGALLNALCAWVRYFGDRFVTDPLAAYGVVMLGQVIGAMAQPIFTNLPSRIAGEWFPVSERDLATVIAAMTNPLGNAAGSVVPTLVVSAPGDIAALMLYQGIWATVLLAVVVVVVRDRPPTPPSAAAALRLAAGAAVAGGGGGGAAAAPPSPVTPAGGYAASALVPLVAPDGSASPAAGSDVVGAEVTDHVRDTAAAALRRLRADFRALFRNRNFLLLMTAFGIGLGMFNAILTVLAQYIEPCGYDDNVAGYAGGALLGAGLAGAFGIGVVLEKTRAYVPILKIGIVGTLASTLFVLGSMTPNKPAQLVAAFGVMGFCLVPLLPVSLENAAECTYPVPEDNSASLLLLAGQLLGIVFIFAMTPMIDLAPTAGCSSLATPVAGLIAACMVVAAGVLLFFKADYRRQAAEASRRAAALGDGSMIGSHTVAGAPAAAGAGSLNGFTA